MGEAGSDRAEGGEDNEGEELKCCCMTIGVDANRGRRQQVAVPVDQLGMASGTRRKRPAERE